MRHARRSGDASDLLRISSIPATVLGATLAACGATMRLASMEAAFAVGVAGCSSGAIQAKAVSRGRFVDRPSRRRFG